MQQYITAGQRVGVRHLVTEDKRALGSDVSLHHIGISFLVEPRAELPAVYEWSLVSFGR